MEKTPFLILGINAKTVFASVMLVANPLVWYYIVSMILQESATNTPEALLIWGLHILGIISSAIVGSIVSKRFKEKTFFCFWIVLGILSPFSLIGFNSSLIASAAIALFLGVSFGLGMPLCMRYFASSIPLEKRGRISGITMLVFALGMILLTIVPSSDLLLVGVLLALWRSLGLLVFLAPCIPVNLSVQPAADLSYRRVLTQQSFILYFIPWAIFSVINYLTGHIESNLVGSEVASEYVFIQNGFLILFAAVGGTLLDYLGRKRVAIFGFVLVGLSVAVLGMYPESQLSWYFSTVAGGMAWGFLFVIFIFTIWGDLSGTAPSDKYYAIGVTPFFISQFIGFTVGNYLAGFVPAYALFSFAAFFLFIAVLPLVYAPETLPEKIMKDRDLKSYLESAKKKVEKDAEKARKKEKAKGTQPAQSNEDSKSYEEAKKLAEKYY
jgi:MFS family permease